MAELLLVSPAALIQLLKQPPALKNYKDVGIGKQGLPLGHALIAAGKHQLRRHARTLNANAGSGRGSERQSQAVLTNTGEKQAPEQAEERSTLWSNALQRILERV